MDLRTRGHAGETVRLDARAGRPAGRPAVMPHLPARLAEWRRRHAIPDDPKAAAAPPTPVLRSSGRRAAMVRSPARPRRSLALSSVAICESVLGCRQPRWGRDFAAERGVLRFIFMMDYLKKKRERKKEVCIRDKCDVLNSDCMGGRSQLQNPISGRVGERPSSLLLGRSCNKRRGVF